MGIEEMEKIEKQADEFMKNAAEARERMMYIAILRTDKKIDSIEKNGCAKNCDKPENQIKFGNITLTGTTAIAMCCAVYAILKIHGVL